MGNCITFQRVVSWVDDGEWDLLESESSLHCKQSPKFEEEQETTMTKSSTEEDVQVKQRAESISTAAIKPTHEVRIKVTKKQLAELLRQAESKGMPVQDVLASLVDTTKPRRVRHTIAQCWRPGLQSIPEIVE